MTNQIDGITAIKATQPKTYRDGQYIDPKKQTIKDVLAFIALVVLIAFGIFSMAVFGK